MDPITDGYEPPCCCWKLDRGPLEEHPVLLTTEPSLQPHLKKFFFNDLLLSYVHWCFSSMCVYVMLSEILELELQTGVDGHVGAGN